MLAAPRVIGSGLKVRLVKGGILTREYSGASVKRPPVNRAFELHDTRFSPAWGVGGVVKDKEVVYSCSALKFFEVNRS